MKTLIRLLPVLMASILGLVPVSACAGENINTLYEEGRAAFFAGQLDVAREKLSKVLATNPNHPQTRAMMAQIKQQIGEDNTALRKSYEKILIDKIEFTDVELGEAIMAVRMKAKLATKDQVVPNIIIKSPELAKKTVSLNLTNMPLSEVLNYLAQVAGVRISYDKTAVLFSSPAG